MKITGKQGNARQKGPRISLRLLICTDPVSIFITECFPVWPRKVAYLRISKTLHTQFSIERPLPHGLALPDHGLRPWCFFPPLICQTLRRRVSLASPFPWIWKVLARDQYLRGGGNLSQIGTAPLVRKFAWTSTFVLPRIRGVSKIPEFFEWVLVFLPPVSGVDFFQVECPLSEAPFPRKEKKGSTLTPLFRLKSIRRKILGHDFPLVFSGRPGRV